MRFERCRRVCANVSKAFRNLDADEIKKQLREEVLLDARMNSVRCGGRRWKNPNRNSRRRARRILISSMQRISSKPNNDLTATIIQLPSEEMKGRIIGREGRNIKSFESATGVTLLIDESPQMVLVSSFDPVRREIARTALDALVKDGRIHPASIEEFVKRAQDEIELVTTQAGEDAVAETEYQWLHPEIIKLLGRLKYRFSYNQNVLDHSIETAFLASLIASEVGLDPNVAKRAGLLHDIGKGVPGELEGSHAVIGAEFIKRYGETPIVVNAVAAHHEEVKPETVYAGLVILADTISAVRPGRASGVDDELYSAPGAAWKNWRFDRGRSAGVCDSGGPEIRVVVSPAKSPTTAREKLRRSSENESKPNCSIPAPSRLP